MYASAITAKWSTTGPGIMQKMGCGDGATAVVMRRLWI